MRADRGRKSPRHSPTPALTFGALIAACPIESTFKSRLATRLAIRKPPCHAQRFLWRNFGHKAESARFGPCATPDVRRRCGARPPTLLGMRLLVDRLQDILHVFELL